MEKKYRADIVVCGAGTAGAVAAIAAADQGADVLVIDQFGGAGGSATLSLVTPMMNSGIPGNPHCSYVGAQINRRMAEIGAAEGKVWFDPEMLKLVLEEMLSERGVRRLYHSFLCAAEKTEDGAVKSVTVANKSGLSRVEGKVLIDATGDADLSALLGLPVQHGNAEDGANQPMSLRYMLGGVNLDAFWAQLRALSGQGQGAERPTNFDGAVTNAPNRDWPLGSIFRRAIAAGDLVEDDGVYWQFFTVPGRGDALALNCPEFFDLHDADDADNLTAVQIAGKRAILRQLQFYKKYLRGFEKAYVSAVAPMVGVRESRRAVTEYILRYEDCAGHARFPDAIARTNYYVDVHGKNLKTVNMPQNDTKVPYYEIPLRALMVKGVSNLLVAGRGFGADFYAQSSARIIPTCRAMGEAAGIAAAMYARGAQTALSQIDGAAVRAEMIRLGAEFDIGQ